MARRALLAAALLSAAGALLCHGDWQTAAVTPSFAAVVVCGDGSLALAARSARTWCRSVQCTFVLADPAQAAAADRAGLERTAVIPAVPWTKQQLQTCRRRVSSEYASAHRLRTLPHQHRFLRALVHARDHLIGDWVLVADEDTVVLAGNLAASVAGLDPREPLWIGDMDRKRRIVCGGGGSVFSRAALHYLLPAGDPTGTAADPATHACKQWEWAVADRADVVMQASGRRLVKELRGCGCAGGRLPLPCAVRPESVFFTQDVHSLLSVTAPGSAYPLAGAHNVSGSAAERTGGRLGREELAGLLAR